MSELANKLYSSLDSQPNPPTDTELHSTLAEIYRNKIDIPNAQREAEQYSDITTNRLVLEGRPYQLTTYMPSNGLRTWQNCAGERVKYPQLLLSHGVASDSRYFEALFKKLNMLGIGCSAPSLPREKGIVKDGDELIRWQAAALVQSHDFLQQTYENENIVLGGHSRGAIVSIKATEKLVADSLDDGHVGLLLLAPAGLDTMSPKNLGRSALNLLPLAYNSLHHSNDVSLIGKYALMGIQTILSNPHQSLIETYQALSMNLGGSLHTNLANVPVFIPAAEHDEFIDHKRIIQLAESAPNANICVVTMNTNHMFGQLTEPDMFSLADPRLLSGQILAWMQSLTDNYRPLSVRQDDGSVRRVQLANSNN